MWNQQFKFIEWDKGLSTPRFGIRSLSRLEAGGPVRVLVTERGLDRTGEPTLSDLSEGLVDALATWFGSPAGLQL